MDPLHEGCGSKNGVSLQRKKKQQRERKKRKYNVRSLLTYTGKVWIIFALFTFSESGINISIICIAKELWLDLW